MDEQLTFEFEPRPTIKGFPELRWTGKRPYRSTQYYPAQLRESYGEEQNGWINKIFWGDNLQVMSHLLKEYRGKIKLIYIDPPFDSKADYRKKIEIKGIGKAESDSLSFEEKQYGDIWTNDEYLQFMYERLLLMRELLSDEGSIYVHCDYRKSHHLRMIIEEVFGIDNLQNELVWCYRGMAVSESHFVRRHDSIFFATKTNSFTFNWKDIAEPLEESTKKKYRYIDKNGRAFRLHGRNIKGSPIQNNTDIDIGWLEKAPELCRIDYLDEKKGAKPRDWFVMDYINVMSDERKNYPTQKPEALLEKLIMASSNPGDLVFDCFMGSGTTQAVAMKLGRRFIGADINLGAIQTTTKRLLSIAEELTPKKTVTYDFVQSQLSMVAEDIPYYVTNNEQKENGNKFDNEFVVKDNLEESNVTSTENIKYTGFEIYNVNNYDFFRNPVEVRDLLIEALEIQPFPQSDVWDGELDGRMVKIMPVNRIATKADLEELKANLPYKTYEKRKEETPSQPVEKITIVCMGHEPDLKASLEQDLSDYKLDIEIMDILRDKADLQLKREAEAEIVREGNKLVVRAFYPMNLMQKLSLQKEYVEDWRQLVDSIMIDWNYDGVVMQPAITDVPGKKELVEGIYDIPSNAGNIKVKITDLLSESLEVEVR